MKDNKCVLIFLNTIGRKTYAYLQDLTNPHLPSTKSLNKLKTLLEKHFEPQPIIVTEQFYFYKWNQGPTESITDNAAGLWRLAKTC